jgi:hypothetical protein
MSLCFFNRLLTTALVAFLLVPRAPAEGDIKSPKKYKSTPTRGEYAEFLGKAHLRIPSGFSYLTGDELAAFHKDAGNVTDSEEVGVLLPDTGVWYVRFFLPTEDPLDGIAKEDVTARADSLLAKLRTKTEATNKDRLAAGKKPLRITGWTHKPLYEKSTNRVSWGYRLTDAEDLNPDEDTMTVETYLFGPNGEVLAMSMVAEVKGYPKPLVEYKKVVDSVVFGSAPGGGWFALSSMAGNVNAVFLGAVVMAIIVGGGLMFRRRSPEKKRPAGHPRTW